MSSFSTMLLNFLGIFGKNEKRMHVREEEKNRTISVIEGRDSAKKALEGLQKIQTQDNDYSTFVVNYYRELGFTVWEYSKDLVLPQSQIHLVIKKEQNIFLIHCRNDNHNLDKENIAHFEEESSRFLDQHQIFESYNVRLLYTMNSLQLDESAYKYIRSSNNIDYEILKSHAN